MHFPTAGGRSVTAAWDPTAGRGGTARPPHLLCRSTGAPASPRHPPPIINFHQWPSGARGGRGTRRFPLIAKINTLKFLQEAEECGTAGKNCFIICNNTKAGGGAGGSRERRGKAEAKGWPRRWGQPQLSTSTGTSSPKDVARGSRCRGGRSRALSPSSPSCSQQLHASVSPRISTWLGDKAQPPPHAGAGLCPPLSGGFSAAPTRLGHLSRASWGCYSPPGPPAPRGAASLGCGSGDVTRRVAVRQAHLLPGRGPPSLLPSWG